MKKYLLYIIFIFASSLKAQQDPMYSMYMFNKAIINPAFAGSSNWSVGTAKYRNQFTGMAGNPTTQTLNYHTPYQKKHLGFGLKIINDKIAIVNTLNASMLLSYHLNFARGKLSFGIDAGIYNRRIDYQKLILTHKNDVVLPTTSQSSVVPDLSWGIYYQKKQWYVGFSQYHLIKQSFNDKLPVNTNSKLANHMYVIAGNVFMINKYWNIEPSMLLKIQPNSATQIDINTILYYQDKIGAGIQYRTGDAIVSILKLNITENLRLAYSYDLTISKLSKYSKGAHEIMISFGIKLPPPPVQKEIHPRYYF